MSEQSKYYINYTMSNDKKSMNIIYAVLAVCISLMFAPQQRLDLEGLFNSLVGVVEYILASLTRYVVYILLIRGLQEIFRIYTNVKNNNRKLTIRRILEENKKSLLPLSAAVLLLVYQKKTVLKDDLPLLFIAFLIAPPKPTINYGTGMACNFFEGYLVHIIPSDGSRFIGFQENIKNFENRQGIFLPVKKLFVIVPKDLFCYPDLKECNKENRSDLPYLEPIASPPHVEKDVAGVKNRLYRSAAYKIYRPGGKLPVPLCAEFATPLHTLKRVLDKRAIYKELVDVDIDELVRDFCAQLERTVERSPDCCGKCVLVHYDNTDDTVNLADVLLDKIRELQPDFEDLLLKKHEERKIKE